MTGLVWRVCAGRPHAVLEDNQHLWPILWTAGDGRVRKLVKTVRGRLAQLVEHLVYTEVAPLSPLATSSKIQDVSSCMFAERLTTRVAHLWPAAMRTAEMRRTWIAAPGSYSTSQSRAIVTLGGGLVSALPLHVAKSFDRSRRIAEVPSHG